MTESAVEEDFQTLAEPFRRELLAYCYRMLGSVHDAEDLVQETYLRAWRAYDRFEGRSSLRTWLYRIATNACLTALEGRGRRPLPSGLGSPSSDPTGELAQSPELPWLEPIPDTMVSAAPDDPAAIVTSRESIRLALITALQHLPPRQRTVLIMRDVLGWRAAEVAEMLGVTTIAVNSMLQRARAQISELAPAEDEVTEPVRAEQRELLDRYVAAFQNYDTAALVTLFSADAVWEMPPFTGWYQTPEHIVLLTKTHCPASMLPLLARWPRAMGALPSSCSPARSRCRRRDPFAPSSAGPPPSGAWFLPFATWSAKEARPGRFRVARTSLRCAWARRGH